MEILDIPNFTEQFLIDRRDAMLHINEIKQSYIDYKFTESLYFMEFMIIYRFIYGGRQKNRTSDLFRVKEAFYL